MTQDLCPNSWKWTKRGKKMAHLASQGEGWNCSIARVVYLIFQWDSDGNGCTWALLPRLICCIGALEHRLYIYHLVSKRNDVLFLNQLKTCTRMKRCPHLYTYKCKTSTWKPGNMAGAFIPRCVLSACLTVTQTVIAVAQDLADRKSHIRGVTTSLPHAYPHWQSFRQTHTCLSGNSGYLAN